MSNWSEVTKANPCPICGHSGWCGQTDDGNAVRCMRPFHPPDDWRAIKPVDTEGGVTFAPVKSNSTASSARAPRDWGADAKRFQQALTADKLRELSDRLGVSESSLRSIGVGWMTTPPAWTFPEFDARGRIIGITYRRGDDDRKLCIKGGKRGLTIPKQFDYGAGFDASEPLIILEGPSDCAAVPDMGLVPVGRPSASGGNKLLCEVLADRHVAIVVEGDDTGRKGAAACAKTLAGIAASVKLLTLPEGVKDARALLHDRGADAARRYIEHQVSVTAPTLPTLPTLTVASLALPADAQLSASARSSPRFTPFPVYALPQDVASIVRSVSGAIGCDDSFAAMPSLVAMAGTIGNRRRLVIGRGHYAPSVLFAAIAAPSGSAKSPAADAIFEPLVDMQRNELRQYQQAIQQFEIDTEHYKRSVRRGDGQEDDLGPEKPERPRQVRRIVRDANIEAVGDLLADNPMGLIFNADELSGWMGSIGRYGDSRRSADRAAWLSIYDARELIVDRKSASGHPVYVPRAAVSVFGTIQPSILERMLGQDERASGLAARLILVRPPVHALRWTDREVSERSLSQWRRVLGGLSELPATTDENGDAHPVDVRLSAEARALYAGFYNEQAERWEQAASDDLAASIAKLRSVAARIALIVHCARVCSGAMVDPLLVDADSMDSGIRIAEWATAEAQRVYAAFGETDEDREARKLAEWIERKGGEVTARDVLRNIRAYATMLEAKDALSALAEAGFGTWHYPGTGPQGGNVAARFRLHTTCADAAGADSCGLGAIRNRTSVSVGAVRTETAHERNGVAHRQEVAS